MPPRPEIITLTCISGIVSNGNEFIFVLLGVHSEVVELGITGFSKLAFHFNAQTLPSASRQQMNIFVACTRVTR